MQTRLSLRASCALLAPAIGRRPVHSETHVASRRRRPWSAVGLALLLGALPAQAMPPNDDCSSPTPINGPGVFNFDMTGAVFSQGEIACGVDIAHDVWFCWTPQCDGAVTITTCSGTQLDTVIEVYNGCACPQPGTPDGQPICCNDDTNSPTCGVQSTVDCNVVCEAGQTYLIRIADKNFNGGPGVGGGTFRIICANPCDPPPPPPGACEDCCAATPRFSGFPGTVAVVTQERSLGIPALADHAVDLIDLSNQPSAPIGTNWCAASYYLPTPAQGWDWQDVGSVFGVTLDDDGNIYLTHTAIYGSIFFGVPGHDQLGGRAPAGQGAGAIYKISTNSGISSWLTSLPNFPESAPATKFVAVPPATELLPGLGNICFDCRSKQLYVSNFEDGRIYRITKSGQIIESYDHATGAITPWSGAAPEPNDPRGWCALGERVWAVGVNEGRLYYSIWAEDYDAAFGGTNRVAPNYSGANEIWSIAVAPNGAISGAAQLEITLPAYPGLGPGGAQVSNPVSDIAFTDTCCMLLAERVMHDDTTSGAHRARNLKYCRSDDGTWVLGPEQYLANPTAADSAAGGIAFDPNASVQTIEQVWTTMDAMYIGPPDCAGGDREYGLCGLPLAGGMSTTDGILIDLDQSTTEFDKFQLGSVDVSCINCAALVDEQILCDIDPATGPTGTYSYTFCLTNNSGVDVHYLLFPTLTPHVVWIAQNGPWADGDTRCFTVTLTGNSGEEICFPLVLADQTVNACCSTELCVTLPECDCLQWPQCEIVCDATGVGGYSVTVTVQNLIYNPSGHLFVIPEPPGSGVTVTPDYLPLVLPLWGISPPLKFTVNAPPDVDEVCLRFTIHEPDLIACCSEVKCFNLPDCTPDLYMPCDVNCDGVISVSDIGPFVLALTNPAQYALEFPDCPIGNADINEDGVVTVSDIALFVQSLLK